MKGRRRERSEGEDEVDCSAASAAAAAAATRRCCGRRLVGTLWRSAAAQGYARRNDTPTTPAVPQLRKMTSSAGTLPRQVTWDAVTSRRRRSLSGPEVALLDGELVPVDLGR